MMPMQPIEGSAVSHVFTCGTCLNGMQANYLDFANVDNTAQEKIYQEALTNLERWKDKTVFIRCEALATQRHVFEAVSV